MTLHKGAFPLILLPLSMLGEAQSELEKNSIEEVLVTAQKREQKLVDVPIAVSAIDSTAIEERKINNISDVGSSLPNVQLSSSPGGNTGALIAIRGAAAINPSALWEPSAALTLNGVYIAKSVGGVFDLGELSQIEVIRGPNTALYGKNSVGGALNLSTSAPTDDFNSTIKLGAGNYGYLEYGARLNTGYLFDNTKILISYKGQQRDGFADNTAVDALIDEFSKLGSDSFLLTSITSLDWGEIQYIYDYSDKNNTVALGQIEGLKTPSLESELVDPDRKSQASISGAGVDQSTTQGHNITLTSNLMDFDIKSISAFRTMQFNDYNDYDGALNGEAFFETARKVDHKQFSQEVQFNGQVGDFYLIGGVLYFSDEVEVENPYYFSPQYRQRQFYGAENQSTALYSQVEYSIGQLTLTGGGRFTSETKTAYVDHPDPGLSAAYKSTNNKESWRNFSPVAIVAYRFNNANIYAKYSEGFRSGGFNGEAATIEEAEKSYKPELLNAFEVGYKANLFSNRIAANLSVFQNTTTDMQLSSYNQATGYSQIENAGEAVTEGLELELNAKVTQYLNAYINYAHLNAYYNDFVDPVTGEQKKDEAEFAYAPENKVAVGAIFNKALSHFDLSMRADYSYTSEQVFYRQSYSALVTASPSYGLLNGSISFKKIDLGNSELAVRLWGKNLTDESYRKNGIPAAVPLTGINYYGDPRTFGVDLAVTF